MRPIDADALREVIEDHVTAVSCCPTVDWSRGKTEFKEQCLEDIDNAPTIEVAKGIHVPDKWISVKDELPEDDQDVLANLDNGEETRIAPCNYFKGVWFDCTMNCIVAIQHVTHWMPIPEPPKEE